MWGQAAGRTRDKKITRKKELADGVNMHLIARTYD
jgi:hypothetical protein